MKHANRPESPLETIEFHFPASFYEYDLQNQKRPVMFAGLFQISALAPAIKTRAKMCNVYSSEGIVTSTSGTSMVFSSVPTSTSAVSTSISGKSRSEERRVGK